MSFTDAELTKLWEQAYETISMKSATQCYLPAVFIEAFRRASTHPSNGEIREAEIQEGRLQALQSRDDEITRLRTALELIAKDLGGIPSPRVFAHDVLAGNIVLNSPAPSNGLEK